MPKLYSTGEFARLCGVKKQTLFHYDHIGLLKPAEVDSKGFRFYAHGQYEDFLMISCLKEAGMSLAQIGDYLSSDDEKHRNEVLASCVSALEARIEYLEQVKTVLESSFAKHDEEGRAGEQDRETTLVLHEEKRMWATPRLDTMNDQELVETVAKIVKTVRPSTVCLPADAVTEGALDVQRHLLIEQDDVRDQRTIEELELAPYLMKGGRYAQIEFYPDEDPALIYKRLLDDIALIDCHCGDVFYETVPTDGESAATVVSTEIFLNEPDDGRETAE